LPEVQQHSDHNKAALMELRRALEDPVTDVRREAALALGQIGDVGAAPALTRRLTDDSEPVRRAAALALGRIMTAEARDALLAALEGDPSVWREAAVALSRHHDPEVVTRLTALVANPEADKHSRRGAALALGALLAGEPLSIATAVPPSTFEDDRGRVHLML
jgi:HEAT repeat protein